MNSLKDQLLKAGLADKQSFKNARKKKQPKLSKKERRKLADVTLQADKVRREKTEQDRILNIERQEVVKQKEIMVQIRQLVERNKINRNDGEIGYSFTQENKIKLLYVTKELQQQLIKNQISIINLGNDRFELVPRNVGEKIAKLNESCVIQNESDDSVLADDSYADYEIPDDLVW